MSSHVLVDSCVYIDFFRTKNKSQTFFVNLIRRQFQCFIPTIVYFEILAGINVRNERVIRRLLDNTVKLSFDEQVAEQSANMSINLRRNRIQLPSSDLFIAATALSYDLPLATLNRKHFEPIEGLQLVLPEHLEQ
ncbi:MAG: type II toxin-antitoxin system VapC family toxin [Thermoguttaceae bacterium]